MEQQTNTTILIEMDKDSNNFFADNAAKWFDNLWLVQSSYRKLLGDTVEKVTELHIKAYLSDMHDRAKQHEMQIENLYKLINRDSSTIRKTVGTVLGKARELLGDAIAFTGDVAGPWQDLQQLYLSNTNTMGAFAVVEQIGLTMGVPEIVDIAIPIEMELATEHLLLQELVLEMAGVAIMYHQSF